MKFIPPNGGTSSFNSAPQKTFKPLILTGVIPVNTGNRVRFLNGQTVAIGKYCSLHDVPGDFDPTKFCVMSVTKRTLNDLSGEYEDVKMRFIADMSPEMYKAFIQAQTAAYALKAKETLSL